MPPDGTTTLPAAGTDAAPECAVSTPPDPLGLAQLWADHFQHLTTLSVAGGGGLLILLEARILDLGDRWWLPLALFVVSAVLAMHGQIMAVDDATRGQAPGRKARHIRSAALAALGAASGAVVGIVTSGNV